MFVFAPIAQQGPPPPNKYAITSEVCVCVCVLDHNSPTSSRNPEDWMPPVCPVSSSGSLPGWLGLWVEPPAIRRSLVHFQLCSIKLTVPLALLARLLCGDDSTSCRAIKQLRSFFFLLLWAALLYKIKILSHRLPCEQDQSASQLKCHRFGLFQLVSRWRFCFHLPEKRCSPGTVGCDRGSH